MLFTRSTLFSVGKEVREAVDVFWGSPLRGVLWGSPLKAGGKNWGDWEKDERQGNSVVELVEMRVLFGSPLREGGKNSRNLYTNGDWDSLW